MGPRKFEMKRIENIKSRQVMFSKTIAGLNKKARQLSVLCNVDVAVVVSSSGGKLHEYCSGGTDRYQKSCLQPEERTAQEGASKETGIKNPCARFRTCKELLEWVKRLDEDPNEVSVSEMTELEEEISHALMQTRSRKTQLMMEQISTVHQLHRKLREDREELKKQVASAKQKFGVGGGD